MMSYLARAKQLELDRNFNNSSENHMPKLTEAPFGTFGMSYLRENEKIICDTEGMPNQHIQSEVADVAVAIPIEAEVAIADNPVETPQQKDRRLRVTQMLADKPHLKQAMFVDDSNPDPEFHIVALAVRNNHGGATSEILIPRAKMDIWGVMEFIQKHGGSVH
jgi:hypothetical protein